MSLIERLKERAKANRKTIVLPESTDERVLDAAVKLTDQGIAKIVLIGAEEEIRTAAADRNLDGIMVVDPAHYDQKEEMRNQLVELRKHKGMTPEQAEATLENPLYFATMLVQMGQADGMVAGAVSSTSSVLRPALQILKTAPDTKLVSAFFLMVVPNSEYGANGSFIFADSGLNENPDPEQLVEIAKSSAESFELLVEEDAYLAMLSYSTKGSASSELTEKMIRATELMKDTYPEIPCDGELQVDAAIVPSVAASKAPGSDVAGKANVLIFPNLDAGNIGYKLVQRLAKAEAYGPVLQGIGAPVNDLSRGCTDEDIVGVVAITAVQAGGKK